jgi:hypothetical protein
MTCKVIECGARSKVNKEFLLPLCPIACYFLLNHFYIWKMHDQAVLLRPNKPLLLSNPNLRLAFVIL